ncbi:DNA polymerase delta subunit 4 [Linum perenne]
MKSYYKQKKTNRSDDMAKPSSSSKSIKKKSPATATLGSGVTQPPALITSRHGAPDLQEDVEKSEQVLREFDMNMAYGPCIGMTRLARWERAQRLGLNPPVHVKNLLDAGNAQMLQSLWDGRV